MIWREEDQQFNKMLDSYKAAFKGRYGEDPLSPSFGEIASLRKMIESYGPLLVRRLIDKYLEMEGRREGDNWFSSNGHTLIILEASAKAVHAHLLASSSDNRVKYKVVSTEQAGFVVEGHPEITEFVVPKGFNFRSDNEEW